ncbi:phosphoprotein [Mount Elgon bat virus]|uniref:Phosphoprotein n=1 Tax=Mount Elgon bat virus TaxID=380434 RepID=A0A0D3R1V3_9RHAB|nr:phosphoprotein [Mount Elgon bat virus]AJR28608.1 phosphoprotein [Mount Elgon bat virus]
MENSRERILKAIRRVPWSNINQNLENLDDDAEEKVMNQVDMEKSISNSDSSDWEKNPVLEISDDDFSEDSNDDEKSGNEDPVVLPSIESKPSEEIEEQAKFLEPIEQTIRDLSREESRKKILRSKLTKIEVYRPHLDDIRSQENLDSICKQLGYQLLINLGYEVRPDLIDVRGNGLLFYVEKNTKYDPPSIPELTKINQGISVEASSEDLSLFDEVLKTLKAGIKLERKRGGNITVDLTTADFNECLIKEVCSVSVDVDDALRKLFKRTKIYTSLTLMTKYK